MSTQNNTPGWTDALWPFLQVLGMIVALLVVASVATAWVLARNDDKHVRPSEDERGMRVLVVAVVTLGVAVLAVAKWVS